MIVELDIKKILLNWPEFISVKNNLKKVAKLEFPGLIYSDLHFLKDLGIFYEIYDKNLIISKDQNLIENFKNLDYSEKNLNFKENSLKIGELLNYPSCCSKIFINEFKGNDSDLISNTFEKSELKNYFLNDIFPVRLVYHFPCYYSCQKSIDSAEKLFNIILKENPKLAKFIEWGLKLPVLIFDKRRFIFFDGFYEDNFIFYTKILFEEDIYSEFFKLFNISYKNTENLVVGIKKKNDLFDKLNKGNKISVSENIISIYLDDKLLFRLNSKIIPNILYF